MEVRAARFRATGNGEGVSVPRAVAPTNGIDTVATTSTKIGIYVGFPNLAIVREAGVVGSYLHLCAVCYMTHRGNDSFLNDLELRNLIDWEEVGVSPKKVIARCVRAGLFAATKGGYLILPHDGIVQ